MKLALRGADIYMLDQSLAPFNILFRTFIIFHNNNNNLILLLQRHHSGQTVLGCYPSTEALVKRFDCEEFYHSHKFWPMAGFELTTFALLGRRVTTEPHALREAFIEAKWSLLGDRQIQKSIGQCKQRLRAVTREGGGSIKHLFV